MTYTSEQIQEKFRELPIDLQKTITSMHSAEAIQVIGKSNGLLIDKMGILGYETGLALIGLTPLSDFPKIIAEKLSIPFEKAVKITEEINTEIFLKIRELMQKKQREEDSEETSDTDVPDPITTKTVEGGAWTDTNTEKMPSRESVLAGIEDPKSISNPQPVNALTKSASTPNPNQTRQNTPTPFARTVLATKIAPAPLNLPVAPTSILEKKLQTVVRSENPAPRQITEEKSISGITQVARDPYREAVE